MRKAPLLKTMSIKFLRRWSNYLIVFTVTDSFSIEATARNISFFSHYKRGSETTEKNEQVRNSFIVMQIGCQREKNLLACKRGDSYRIRNCWHPVTTDWLFSYVKKRKMPDYLEGFLCPVGIWWDNWDATTMTMTGLCFSTAVELP